MKRTRRDSIESAILLYLCRKSCKHWVPDYASIVKTSSAEAVIFLSAAIELSNEGHADLANELATETIRLTRSDSIRFSDNSLLWELEEIAAAQTEIGTLDSYKDALAIRRFIVSNAEKMKYNIPESYAAFLFNFAVILSGSYQFNEAIAVMEDLVSWHKEHEWYKFYDEALIDLILTYNFLAANYGFIGDNGNAASAINEAISLNSTDDGSYFDSGLHEVLLSQAASTYQDFGRMTEAMNYRLKEIDLSIKSKRKNPQGFATSLWGLGSIFFNLGDITSAEIFSRFALQIDSLNTDLGSIEWGLSLENMAARSISMGDLTSAKNHLLEAIDIFAVLGADSPVLNSCRIQLAEIHMLLGDYEAAFDIAQSSSEQLRDVLGESMNWAEAQSILGQIALRKFDDESAITHFEAALSAIKSTLGENSYWSANLRMNYAEALLLDGQWEPSRSQYLMAHNSINNQFEMQGNLNITLNTGVHEQLYRSIEGMYMADILIGNDLDYDLWLNLSSHGVAGGIPSRHHAHDSLKPLYAQRDILKRAQTTLIENSNMNPDRLEELVENKIQVQAIENALPKIDEGRRLTSEDLVFSLAEEELVYDFLELNVGPKGRELSVLVGFETSTTGTFTRIIREWPELQSDVQNHIGLVQKKGLFAKELRREVDSVLITHLCPSLHLTDRVYIRPDGILNQISFANLIHPETNRPLLNSALISQIFSAKSLALDHNKTYSTDRIKAEEIVFFGNPDFDKSLASRIYRGGGGEQLDTSEMRKTASFEKKIFSLPGTSVEIQEASKLFAGQGIETRIYEDFEASEYSFKSLNSPSILHVATHGYFYPDSISMPNEQSQNLEKYESLLRTGLLLSGAGNFDEHDKNQRNAESGWLSAYEISLLDFGKTDLVVLSACNSGRGQYSNGKGVMGMPRAFKIAGASQIVMSLWEVDDFATSELMRLFYLEYLKCWDAARALRQAQIALSSEFPDQSFWGPWVAITE